jgi:hypothetical protein
MTTATRSRNVTISQGNGSRAMQQAAAAAEQAMAAREVTAEDIKAEIEARVQAQLDEALARPPTAEVAELLNWWDIFAIGPIQPILNPPVLPHQVVKAGEPAFAASVIILNPFLGLPGGLNAAQVLSQLQLPYEVLFQTSDLTNMVPAASTLIPGSLINNVFVYVDVAPLPTAAPGMYETNILARFLSAGGAPTPQFAGFASAVLDIDAKLIGPGPVVNFQQPVRYMVYP